MKQCVTMKSLIERTELGLFDSFSDSEHSEQCQRPGNQMVAILFGLTSETFLHLTYMYVTENSS